MRVSEHLQQLHKSASRFHRAMEAAHGAIMEKSEKGTSTHEFHKAAHHAHGEAADGCDALLADCQKAISAADLEKANRLVADGVHGIAPPRLIPRTGAPAPGAMPGTTKAVDGIIPSVDDENFFY